jgi:DNA adenine methylase
MATSPLRYPGGKAKLFPFFSELIRQNNLFSTEYCEPYAGGAGLAIKLLINGYAERISINDIDDSIYAFWYSILRDTDRFCALIERTPFTIEEWHKQKAIWDAGDLSNPLCLGFSAYFLNRTNRSGIIEGAGPIGGYKQEGSWKLDVRMVKDKQIDNIRCLSKYSKQIELSNIDALQYVKTKISQNETFIYLDPPYYVKGQKLYKNFYEPRDHKKIASYLEKKRNGLWVVSYDDVSEIREAYSAFSPITYFLNYSAGEKTLGKEVMFVSDSIQPPLLHGFCTAA